MSLGGGNHYCNVSCDWYCHLQKSGRIESYSKTETVSSAMSQQPPKGSLPELGDLWSLVLLS